MMTLLAALTLLPATALAQDSTPDRQEASDRAIEQGKRGVTLYEQGDWLEALKSFEAAEALYHSPVFLLYAARSLRNAGRLQQAEQVFERLLEEKLDDTAPEPWRRAQVDGRLELEKLEEQLAAANSAPTLAAVPPPVPPVATHAPASRAGWPVQKRGPYVPGLVLVGVGGAAVVAGGVVGILALNQELPSSCREQRCLSSQKDSVERVLETRQHLALASDVLWISGAAAAAVGVVLLLVDPRPNAAVSAQVGPGGGAFTLSF